MWPSRSESTACAILVLVVLVCTFLVFVHTFVTALYELSLDYALPIILSIYGDPRLCLSAGFWVLVIKRFTNFLASWPNAKQATYDQTGIRQKYVVKTYYNLSADYHYSYLAALYSSSLPPRDGT